MLVTTNYENAQSVTYDLDKLRACEGTIERWETNMDGGYKYKHFKEGGSLQQKGLAILSQKYDSDAGGQMRVR